MKLRPFKEMIGLSKDKLREVMAGPRARKIKAKAEMKKSEIETQIISLESEIQELCAKDDLDFDALFDKMDRIDLLERRSKQYNIALADLFPEGE